MNKENVVNGFPWWSSGWESMSPLQGAWVQSLDREVRSHRPHSVAKKKERRKWKKKRKHTHTHIYTQGIRFSRKGNPAICNNVDEPVGQHTKWNKPNTERQILYDFIYMWNLKKLKLAEVESRTVVTEGWRIMRKCWSKDSNFKLLDE